MATYIVCLNPAGDIKAKNRLEMEGPFENNLDLEFTFENPEHAAILKKVLDANPELKPTIVTREITVLDNGIVRIHFSAKDPKILRIASTSLLELIETVVDTMKTFAPPTLAL